MKRLFVFVLISLAVAGCGTRTVHETTERSSVDFEPPKDYVQYTKESLDYEIYHPEAWVSEEDSENSTVMFVSPRGSGKDASRENCSVSTVALPRPLSVDRFYELNLKHTERTLSNFENHGKDISAIRGRKSVRADFSQRSGQSTYRSYQYFLSNESTGYIVTCTTTAGTFDKHKETFRRIASTFKIK